MRQVLIRGGSEGESRDEPCDTPDFTEFSCPCHRPNQGRATLTSRYEIFRLSSSDHPTDPGLYLRTLPAAFEAVKRSPEIFRLIDLVRTYWHINIASRENPELEEYGSTSPPRECSLILPSSRESFVPE